MYEPLLWAEDGRRALGANPHHIAEWLPRAQKRAAIIRRRLDELEMLIARAGDLLQESGTDAPWTPASAPPRHPTLHRAMEIALRSRGNQFTYPRDLAADIARRGLYRRRNGMPATARDISARASAYPERFERYFYTIRLRLPGNPPPEED